MTDGADGLMAYTIWNNKGGVGKTTIAFQIICQYAERHPDENILCMDVCPQTNLSSTLLSFLDTSTRSKGVFTPGAEVVQQLETSEVCQRDHEGKIVMGAPKNIAGLLKYKLSRIRSYPELTVQVASYNKNLTPNIYLLCGSSKLDLFSSRLSYESNTEWDSVHSILRTFAHEWYLSHGRKKTMVFIDTNPALTPYTEIAICAADRLLVPINADDFSRQAIKNLITQIYPQPDDKGEGLLAEFESQSFGHRLRRSVSLKRPLIHCIIHNKGTTYDGRSAAVFRALCDNLYKLGYDYYRKNGVRMFTPRLEGELCRNREARNLQTDGGMSTTPDQALQDWKDQYTCDLPDGKSTAVASMYCGIPAYKVFSFGKYVKEALDLSSNLNRAQAGQFPQEVERMVQNFLN